MDIPLEDNQLKEAKAVVLEYAASMKHKQKRILPRQHSTQSYDDPIIFEAKHKSTSATSSHNTATSLSSHPSLANGLGNEKPPPKVAKAVASLWASPAVQRAYLRRNEFQLYDSAAYFLRYI